VVEPITHSFACMDVLFQFNGEHYRHTIYEGMEMMCKTDHLVLCSFKFQPTGLLSKLDVNDVEFKFNGTRVKRCGIRLLNVSTSPDDSEGSSETESPDDSDGDSVTEYHQQSGEKCDDVETESSKKRMRVSLLPLF